MERIKTLEEQLTSPGLDHLDDIDGLFEVCETPDVRIAAEALKSILRVLDHYRKMRGKDGKLTEVLKSWLHQHDERYFTTLGTMCQSKDSHAQVCAVRLALAAIRAEGQRHSNDTGAVRSGSQRRIQALVLQMLVAKASPKHAVRSLFEEFVTCFVDVRHDVVSYLKTCLEQASSGSGEPAAKRAKKTLPFVAAMQESGLQLEELVARAAEMLQQTPEPGPGGPEPDDGHASDSADDQRSESTAAVLIPLDRPTGVFVRQYRKLFQDTWLKLLSLPAPLVVYKKLFQFLPTNVMPHVSQPLMMASFYLRAFNSDSLEVSMLSLSGLFVMLTKYGLGDPEELSSSCNEYYAQLYSLVKPEIFLLAKRARFQRLLAASLTSGLLPARQAAAFAKRCMHVAVCCSDVGTVMWLMSVTYTLIQKHHNKCKYLLSRAAEDGITLLNDPYTAAEPLSEAVVAVMRTSLWEVEVLKRHHIPSVSLLATMFLQPFFKNSAQKLDSDVHLDLTPGKLYAQALRSGERQATKWKRKGQKTPLAFKLEEDELTRNIDVMAARLAREGPNVVGSS